MESSSTDSEQTNHGLELIVDLGGAQRNRRAERLRVQLRAAVLDGRLRPGFRLPPSRTLARDLGVARSVVVSAYEQLTAEGYLTTRPGGGTSIAAGAARRDDEPPSRRRTPATESVPRYDFRSGRPEVSDFPREAWARSQQHALRALPDTAFAYGDPQGDGQLRQEVADYLVRVRAARADPDNMVVVSGVAQGLMICTTLVRQAAAGAGARVAVEDPGSPATHDMMRAWGATLVPTECDEHGLVVRQLPDARAVLVTPAHQFPTGAVLAPDRRTALLERARRTGVLVLEDDYDAEFRYDHDPVGCLQGLDRDHVIHLNSVSKTLAPALRLGWMIVPDRLVDDVTALKRDLDLGAPQPLQATFAHFLREGHYERHITRQRRRYRARRAVLLDALARHLPGATVKGVAAGLHLWLELPPGVPDTAVARAAADWGITVTALSPLVRALDRQRSGLVIGYGNIPDHRIEPGIALLARAMATVSR